MEDTRTIVPIRNEADSKLFGFDIRAAPENLSDVNKSEFLLQPSAQVDTKSFIFLNKPPDVRMNGEFDVTVETILLAWYPNLVESQLKWVHRLDFATSGVLCVGLTMEAARIASEAFQTRKTKKEYIAIVEGTLDPKKWPITSGNAESSSSSTSRNKRYAFEIESIEVEGYTEPPKSWQQLAMENCLNLQWKALEELYARLEHKDSDVMESISRGKDYHATNKKARKMLKKLLKKHNIEVEVPISEMSEYVEAAEASAIYRKKCKEKYLENLRATDGDVQEDESLSPSIYRKNYSSSERLVIALPIHQAKDNFYVEMGGQPSKPGRYSETEVEVLEYGKYLGRPVTKVRLHPITGRRHQLRLHMKTLGHAIVGDATYNENYTSASHRMMLHAHRLSIDLSQFLLPTRNSETLSSPVTIEAKDPFVINQQGEVEPMLPSYVLKRRGEMKLCSD